MSHPVRRIATLGAAAAVAAAIAACAQPGTQVSPSPSTGGSTNVVRQAEPARFEICKAYSGAVGPTVTFNVTVDIANNGSIDQQSSVQLADGQCAEVWDNTALLADRVTVTEVVPAGYTASYVRTTVTLISTTTLPAVQSNTVTDNVGDAGHLVVFTNTENPPIPPPTGQGCTPGYWKARTHLDSWPALYTPDTLFSDVFEDAFPGMTLLQVLSQGGGGLYALGRHTVAALLNAESAGVNYPLTTAEIIAGFNAVFPGGDYETLHVRWAALNEAGCPLN